MLNLPPELGAALLGRGMVFVRGRLDEANATNVIAQLLLIARTAPTRSVDLYVDSPGGSLAAALSIYDMLQTSGLGVATTCVGVAGGASVLVLAGGLGGRRFALPHARIHLTNEPVDIPRGAAVDQASQVGEAARVRDRWITALTSHAAHSAKRLEADIAEGTWLSAAEGRDYGLVDGIIPGVPTA